MKQRIIMQIFAATLLALTMPVSCMSSRPAKENHSSHEGISAQVSGTQTTRTEDDCRTLGLYNCYSPIGAF
ncbi:hypothetical protein [Nitrospira sp. Nam74]